MDTEYVGDLVFDSQNHKFSINGHPLPSVTTILSDIGFINKDWFTEDGRTRGSFVHLACQLDDQGELDEESLDDTLRPYLTAWRSFKSDSGIDIKKIEEPGYFINPLFAGIPDRVCILNKTKTIIDIKSGVVSPVTGLQLAAYDIIEGGIRNKRLAVHLTEEGKYKVTEYKDPQDRHVFLSAVACYHWKQNNLKGK